MPRQKLTREEYAQLSQAAAQQGLSVDEFNAAVQQAEAAKTTATPSAPTYEEKMQRPLSERITDPGLMWEHIKRASPLQLFRAENLPSTGGAIGGAIGTMGGPVGTVGGAALGGATGRWAQAMLEGKGAEALPEMVKSAALEGATSFLPEAVTAGVRGAGQAARRIGKQMVLSDIVPAAAVIKERAIAEGKPLLSKAEDIAKTIIETGATTPERAETLLQGLSAQLQQAAEQATTEGKVLNLEPRIRENIGRLAQWVENMKLPRQARQGIAATTREFLADSPLTRNVVKPQPLGAAVVPSEAYQSPLIPREENYENLLRTIENAIEDARRIQVEPPPTLRGPGPQQFTGPQSRYPRSTARREIRPDITPTQALKTLETPSAFSKETTEAAGHKETIQQLELALRDALKDVVPGAEALQAQRGNLIDVKRVVDPAVLRQVRGNLVPLTAAGTGILMGEPLTGLATGLAFKGLRSKALPIGARLAGKWAPPLMRTGHGAIPPEVYADLLRAALMEGFENETPQP
jgi:hypothetical protein